MPVLNDPTRNVGSDMVMAHYAANPDLIAEVLTQMGAQQIGVTGGTLSCTCPLHNGDGKNFKVWFDNQIPIWCCFSRCHMGKQPLITLPMRKFGWTAAQSMAWLAQIAAIPFDPNNFVVPKEAIEQAEIRAFNRRLGVERSDVPNYFPEEMVHESMAGGQDFFLKHKKPTKRFSREVLDTFQVGFVKAPRWTWADNGKHVGWFDDRVSIPIRMADSRLIGFAGRRLDDIEFQKYNNLHGTKKGHTLYGSHLAASRRAIEINREIILVEGYGDVWRAWEYGIFNVWSFMGTDPTDSQIALIGEFSLDRITTYFDGDIAGQTAAEKYASRLQDQAQVRNACPPLDCDPADLLDRDSYLAPLANSKPFSIRRTS